MRIAFVIPMDLSRHLGYAQGLVDLISPNSDVYVILTFQNDLTLWNLPPTKGLNLLVLSDWVSNEAIGVASRNQSMPTFKKWLGMKRVTELTQEYSYLITCDCEIRVLRPLDGHFIQALSSQFTFVGDHTHNPYIEKLLLDDSQFDPPESTIGPCNKDLYCWWSSLPVYDTSNLKEFLNHVQADNPVLLARRLFREPHDHLVYQRYVCFRGFKGCRFVCMTHDLGQPAGWSLEWCPDPKHHEAARKLGVATLWKHHEISHSPEVYIIFHLDRRDAK